jgi:ABC-type spermidine/putrescine transport system permease subunit II
VAPALTPHLLVSWLFAFAVSFDEVVITFFIAGIHTTIPKKMFITLRNEIDPTITAVSALLIAVTVLIGIIAILLLQRRILAIVGAEKA